MLFFVTRNLSSVLVTLVLCNGLALFYIWDSPFISCRDIRMVMLSNQQHRARLDCMDVGVAVCWENAAVAVSAMALGCPP